MTLLALILTLVLEQFRPLNAARYLYPVLAALGDFFESRFNDGQARHGTAAWCLMILPPVLLSAVLYFILFAVHPLAALLFNIIVLYYTMGFRHSSHFFTRIHAALRAQELQEARRLIGEWRGHQHDRSSTQEIVRLTLEQGIVGSHRQVFALIVCFVLLPGPSGAVLYRMADYFASTWGKRTDPDIGEFGRFARRAFHVIEWLPARVTATAFSIVGDFEDAAYCWRTQSGEWHDPDEGILLAAGAGALGVRVGLPIQESGEIVDRPELGTGDEAEVEHLQSFVGLVRRTLVLSVLGLVVLGLSRIAA
ncbi:CobD/CbiB family protein [Uliginosibacterium paludis]|jgi:adenosylcobinamide-phosphate synthase|uniref:Cobalamin biosynthesis protein CobD n=1 Tax=Uliginosibacterium paludis TaxID=1615952 RepID=A0ABV2CKD0_9RHOO